MNILGVSIDDAPWSRLTEQLQKLKMHVTTVAASKAAYKKLAADPSWDLVIVNADHADENGAKLLRSIKKDPTLAWLPVIVVGTTFAEERITEYGRHGVQDIVVLPVQSDTLAGKIASADVCGKRRVMVVDDEEAIRDLIAEFLRLQRFTPVPAESGEEALEILKEQTIHLVVSDIMMPGMNGTELLKKIKEQHSDIPVILITGYGGEVSPRKAIEYGADGYFSKPFKNVELIYTIRRVLQTYGIRPGARSARPQAQTI